MFKVTLETTRKDTSVLWEDPSIDISKVFNVLVQASGYGIQVRESLSDDNLTRTLVWTAPSEEGWDEFSTKYILKDGKIDDSWFISNDITFTVTRENIDE